MTDKNCLLCVCTYAASSVKGEKDYSDTEKFKRGIFERRQSQLLSFSFRVSSVSGEPPLDARAQLMYDFGLSSHVPSSQA